MKLRYIITLTLAAAVSILAAILIPEKVIEERTETELPHYEGDGMPCEAYEETVIAALELTVEGMPIDPVTGGRKSRYVYEQKTEAEDAGSSEEMGEAELEEEGGQTADTETLEDKGHGDREVQPSDQSDVQQVEVVREVRNEQETGKESIVQHDRSGEGNQIFAETQGDVKAPAVEQTDGVQQAAQTAPVPDAPPAEVVGTVEAPQGDSLDGQPEGDAASTIPEILKASLDGAGIGWWYPYACAQIEQESHWDPWAVNPNGLDYGILQYRLTSPDGTRQYWTEPESIYDVNAQIRVYVRQVSARLAAGLSIEETISRHYTSDYVTEVNWKYVSDVLRWLR